MKPTTAEVFPASMALFLSITSHIASTVALTIPTTPSINLIANASSIFPLLFPSLNASSLRADQFEPNCTPSDDDETWYNEDILKKWRYDSTCHEAMRLFNKERKRRGEDNFEFLAPEARPATPLQTMQTPRRYTFGGSGLNPNPSCTVIVAMLDFVEPGQLPGQPPGPFQPTDVASFEELIDAGGEVFVGCIRARGGGILPNLHFGWVRAGRGGNMGVFLTGTKSQIDRSIPRGVHP